jgi:hypothetical protein
VLVILSKCSRWNDDTFSVDQKRALVDKTEQLQRSVHFRGRVADLEQEELFPFLPPVVQSKYQIDLADLAVNRDRTALITHPGYFSGRKESSTAAHAANPGLRKPNKKSKPAQIVKEYIAFASSLADKFSMEDIRHQLAIRGVIIGPHCKKKKSLIELWKENSALPDRRLSFPSEVRPPAPAVPIVYPLTPPRLSVSAAPAASAIPALAVSDGAKQKNKRKRKERRDDDLDLSPQPGEPGFRLPALLLSPKTRALLLGES